MSGMSHHAEFPSLVFAGGGTGGHLFPLLAVADAVRAMADVSVVFVGTARGIESRVLPARGERLELLALTPIKGGGIARALRGMGNAAWSLPRAQGLLKSLRPKAVLSIGGYASGPVGVAARTLGIPVALLEPNSILGLANRWLRPFARRAYVAFPETAQAIGAKARLTGVPLRAGFEPHPYEASADRLHVLVLGGSQGAAPLNERMPEALSTARRTVPMLTVLHQAGRDRDVEVQRRYAATAAGAAPAAEWFRVVPFIEDVAREIARADVVVQRSGASAVAELCAVGRPAIFIPFAQAADDHQRKNAQALEAAGAAVCIGEAEADPARLADEIVKLAQDSERRARMARAAAQRACVGAAQVVAGDLLELANIPHHRSVGDRAVVASGVPRV